MASMTIRFLHYPTMTPVIELEVCSPSSIGKLRSLLEEKMAEEESCVMRAFTKWYSQISIGGRKRLIEIIDDTEIDEPLSTVGIEDYTSVLLEGPITADSVEGVGQAVAILGANMRRQQAHVAGSLYQLRTTLLSIDRNISILVFPEARNSVLNDTLNDRANIIIEEKIARIELCLIRDADLTYIGLMDEAEDGFCQIVADAQSNLKESSRRFQREKTKTPTPNIASSDNLFDNRAPVKDRKETEEDDDDDEGEYHLGVQINFANLEMLPPSTLSLDTLKREYSNNDTRTRSAPWFFQNFDQESYSCFWANYKYNEENQRQFMTANLCRGWFQRMEGNRKYAFGVALIIGEDRVHELTSFWVFRGKGLPKCVADVDDSELFEWIEINDINAEKEKITDYLCWEGPTLGKPVLEGRTFK